MTTATTIELNNRVAMPMIGFMRAAITAGYRPKPMPITPLMTKLPMTDQLVMLVG